MKINHIITFILGLLVSVNSHSTGVNGLSITWTGTTSTSWNTASNWSSGTVPTENDDVIIPAGTTFSPIVANGVVARCNSIKINNSAYFTVETGGVLQISNLVNNNPVAGAPTLITTEASLVTFTSALLGGTIVNIGDCPVTKHGIAIGTAQNPTTSGTTFQDIVIAGTGSYTIPVNSLLPNTTYYVRAYATNCKGTNYGNEISFTTGGGGTAANGYFSLVFDGVTYFSYDLLDFALASTIFTEGDTRFAYATFDLTNNVFNVTSQSSFLLNNGATFGYSFAYTNPDVMDTGTYVFAKFNSAANKDISISVRTGAGNPDPALSPNYATYQNTGNYTRLLNDQTCIDTEVSSAVNTLIITKWGEPGNFIEGTINGTVYENIKTGINCTNSFSKPFSVIFKLKRLQ